MTLAIFGQGGKRSAEDKERLSCTEGLELEVMDNLAARPDQAGCTVLSLTVLLAASTGLGSAGQCPSAFLAFPATSAQLRC